MDLPTRPCPVSFDRARSAFAGELRALDAVVDGVSPADLARMTRCDEWSLEVLLAHLVRGVDRLRAYLTETLADEPPSIGWLSYWRTVAVVTDAASITQRAEQFAQQVNHRAVGQVWAEVHERALEVLDSAPPDRGVPTPFGVLRLDHYLTTRLLEVTVHGLDLKDALGLEPVVTPGALAITTEILDAMLPGDRAPGLDDDLAFVLAATGRRPSDDSRLPLVG